MDREQGADDNMKGQLMHQGINIDIVPGGKGGQGFVDGADHDIVEALYFFPVKAGLDESPVCQPVFSIGKEEPFSKIFGGSFGCQRGFMIVRMIFLEDIIDEGGVLGQDKVIVFQRGYGIGAGEPVHVPGNEFYGVVQEAVRSQDRLEGGKSGRQMIDFIFGIHIGAILRYEKGPVQIYDRNTDLGPLIENPRRINYLQGSFTN